jgi:GAF domain-containing protein
MSRPSTPRPLRLPDVSAHPRSYGFPVGHPPMRRFLGVPVLLRGRAWGNLYLTEKEDGDFTAAHEEAAVILAEWAALAVENARLYQAAAARADVLSALRLPADGAPPGAVLRTRRPLRHRGDGRGRAPARLPPRRRARAQPLGPRAARRNPAGARRPARAAVLGLRSGRADALERAVRQPRASGSWPCASGCSSPAAG